MEDEMNDTKEVLETLIAAQKEIARLKRGIEEIAAEMRRNPGRHPCDACPEWLESLANG